MKVHVWYLIGSVWAGAFALWGRNSGMTTAALLSFGVAMLLLGMAVQDARQRNSARKLQNVAPDAE